MAEGPGAGIDFGTCWSSVVVRRRDGSLLRVREPVSGSASVPSSVVLAVDGGLSWGTAAENVKRSRPYQSQFKRRWGEPEPLLLGELGVTAVELVAGFVGWLRGLAEAAVGEPLASVVATVPAAYEGHRRELMVHAMAQAGFAEQAVRLEVEPVAAARFALADRPARPGERLVVYDLGGGTFDVAVVEVLDDGGLAVLGHGGLPDVGGATFDRMVRDHVLARDDVGELAEALARSRRAWESDDPKEQARLLRPALELDDFCRRVKHQLSGAEVAEDWVPSCDVLFEMSRGEFESLIGPALAETLECCDGVVSDAGLGWGDIDRVVTVGGSSRVPAVSARLAERFGRPVQTVSDPELAVAEGAALPVEAPGARHDRGPDPAGPEDAAPPSGEPGGQVPGPVAAFLTDHPAGSTVTGTMTADGTVDVVVAGVGVLSARLIGSTSGPVPAGSVRRVVVVGASAAGQLEVRLPDAPKQEPVARRSPTASTGDQDEIGGTRQSYRSDPQDERGQESAMPPSTQDTGRPEPGPEAAGPNDADDGQSSGVAERILDQQSISTAGIPLGTLVLTNRRLMVTKPSARVALAGSDPLGAKDVLYERSVGDIVDIAKSMGAFTITFRDGERRRFQLLASGMIDRGTWIKSIRAAAATFEQDPRRP